jgi:hypothetical protein
MTFFGPSIRNGLPIGLGSAAGFGTTPFTPAELFYAGEQGFWYDPTDITTLFQDSAGTTPVTAVEQAVGLMLDKSKGLVLGAELVPDVRFDAPASWTPETAAWAVAGGKATYTKPGSGVQYLESNANVSLTAGTWYKLTLVLSDVASGSVIFGLFNKTASVNILGGYQTITAGNGTYNFYFSPTSSITGIRIYGNSGGTASLWSLNSFSIQALPGNHAFQTSSTKRPVLRARYNLLTYSEQFDNAGWNKGGITVTANAGVAPDGTTTADKLVETATTGLHYAYQGSSISGVQYTVSCYAKAAERTWVALYVWDAASRNAFFDLQNGVLGTVTNGTASITAVGNGWYLCRYTATVTGTGGSGPLVASANGTFNYAGDGTSGILVWGADLRPTSQATGLIGPTYQRIAAATDYDVVGYLSYLAFDGVDDALTTNSIDPGAVDKAQVFAGVRKLSDASRAMVAELSAVATNPGTFYFAGPDTNGAANFGFYLDGAAVYQPTTFTAPTTQVISVAFDRAASALTDKIIPRFNGVVNQTNGTNNTTTGNFSNNALFIGARNQTSLYFNGWLSSLIGRFGPTLSSGQISATEAWVNTRTGAY